MLIFGAAQPQSVVRWDLPPTSYTDVGLGSGISWALAPDFCEWLLPRFPEEPFGRNSSIAIEFVSCSELRDAVNRAFGTWAANHKKISFTDVTDECARHIAETGAAECDWVEVYLKPDLSGYAEENGLAAYVQHRMEYARAGAAHSTAGAALADAIVVLNTTMHVRATDSFCWYLDTTFCYNIHRWEEVKDLDVVTMMRAFFAMLVVVSSIIVIAVLVRIFAAACSCSAGRHRTASVEADARAAAPNACVYHLCGGPRCEAVLAYLAKMPVGVLLCCLFFLMFAPVFYYKVFLPCWCAAPSLTPRHLPSLTPHLPLRRDCYDFEATIAHEVGHVLGFHHPDQFPDANLRAARDADGVAPLPMDNASCWAPLQHVELGALPSGADTIMHSTTKHRDRTCLTADDLEGLNYLYPICDGAATEPNCVKTRRLGGWLRLAAAVATPYVVVSVALMMLQCIARGYQWRKVHELEETTHRLRKEARAHEGEARADADAPRRARRTGAETGAAARRSPGCGSGARSSSARGCRAAAAPRPSTPVTRRTSARRRRGR